MSKISKGKFNLQAVQVLNKVEYDVLGNPVGLIESPTDQTSCNFGIDRLPRRGGCYKGDGIAYLSVAGIQITDTYSVSTGSGNPIISSNRIDIVNGTILFDLKIYRASVLWAWFKCDENYDTTCYDSSGNGHHGTIVNAITVTPEENPNSIHQYQNEYSYHNEVGYSKSGSIFIPKNESITIPSFKDVLGNNLQFFGKVPGRAKFVESNCFQQQISACYMAVTGLLATDMVTVFGSSAVPTLSAGRMDFVVGSKYYGISIFRSAVLLAYYPMCESIINPAGHIYHDCSGNGNHATLINGAVGNEGKQNEFHYLQKGFNKTDIAFIPKHLTNNTDYLGDILVYPQDGKSFLPSGCFLRQYQQPSLIQADKTSGVWFDPNAEPYDVAYETLTLQDPINEQIFIGNSDKTKKLGPISTHKVGLTAVQKLTERVVRNVVDDALIEDPAFSHNVTVAAGDLAYSLYNQAGYTMNGIVDWGDGTTQSINTTAAQTITKTYATAGTYTVRFTGTMQTFATYLHSGTTVNCLKITKVNNWGNCNIRRLRFEYCSNLVSIPDGPITGMSAALVQDVTYLFRGCVKLIGTIPSNLLQYVTATNFDGIFLGCTSLTSQIPENLFRYCPNLTTVASAFQSCTGLTGQIPEDLLRYNTKLTNVAGLFNSCSGLSGSIPEKLLRYNTLLTDASSLFHACTNLTGVIPSELFRYNPEIATFLYTLRNCPKLTGSIPTDLFRYNTKSTTFYGTLQFNSGLTGSIPEDLLRYNTLVTNLQELFYRCTGLTGAIPQNLLRYNTLTTNMYGLFYGCTGITGIPTDLFRYNVGLLRADGIFYNCTGITSIPATLFDYNTNVTTFANTFYNTRITTIPSGLFVNNTKVTTFAGTFQNCTALSLIPSNLFDTNTLVTTFDSVFNGCTGVTSIPADLFRYNAAITNMTGVFQNTRITAIPIDIFRYNTLVTTFAYTFASLGSTNVITLPVDLFRYNIAATSFVGTFQSSKLYEIPIDLFKYNTEVTNFTFTFQSIRTSSIYIQLPTDLFRYNTKVTLFESTFDSAPCSNVPQTLFMYNTEVISFRGLFYNQGIVDTTIPVDFFRYNTKVTTFREVFRACITLTTLPEDLFYYNGAVTNYNGALTLTRNILLPTRLFNITNLSKVTDWTNFLNVLSTAYSPTGTIQKIWSTTEGGDVTYTVQPTKTDAFNNCTALSNYAEIPVAWT